MYQIFSVIFFVVAIYVLVAQVLSGNWFLFCKQHKGKSTKECRNITCSKGRECPYNFLYNEKE